MQAPPYPDTLYDPEAPAPSPPRRRRRWLRRLLIGANVLVAVAVIAVAGGYGYLRWKFGQIDKVDLCSVLSCEAAAEPDRPLSVLVVGSDSRADLDAEDQKSFGTSSQTGPERSDTIIVLRVDPQNDQAAMLSIPRDLFLPIAGTGRSDRINTAFSGGPERLIRTLDESLGIQVDHYVQVDFKGFRGIVEAVGGVPIYSPARARDKVSGLDIPNPGCVTLDGDQALALVRSRNYQYFENGKWRTDPTGDIGRITRQQDFIRRVLKKANEKARGLNLLAINRLVDTGIRNVKIDESFDTGTISRLALRFKSLDPSSVQMLTVPGTGARVNGASVLRIKQPEAQQAIDTFLGKVEAPAEPEEPSGDKVPAIPPSSIRLRVLNGSGVEGQARSTADGLSKIGFAVAGLGQARSFDFTDSVISYGKGQRDKALVVRSKIGGKSTVKEDLTLQAIDVVVTTGSSFTGVVGVPSGSATTAPAKAPARPTTTLKPAPEQDPGAQC
ncbi:MAG TPA: LCP family protein [Acidimicrobiales bacterium]|nr:LCP family protein [Acidimicrobiales bacterium]